MTPDPCTGDAHPTERWARETDIHRSSLALREETTQATLCRQGESALPPGGRSGRGGHATLNRRPAGEPSGRSRRILEQNNPTKTPTKKCLARKAPGSRTGQLLGPPHSSQLVVLVVGAICRVLRTCSTLSHLRMPRSACVMPRDLFWPTRFTAMFGGLW